MNRECIKRRKDDYYKFILIFLLYSKILTKKSIYKYLQYLVSKSKNILIILLFNSFEYNKRQQNNKNSSK